MDKKAIAYIDGFNLYNGIMDKGWGCYRWLDVASMATHLVPDGYRLELVRYFTTRVKGNNAKHARQARYIGALQVHLGSMIDIKYGRFQMFQSQCKYCKTKPILCSNCHNEYLKPNEKKTDVNVATMMLIDAAEKKTNCIIMISGDSDYETTLSEISRVYPDILRVVAFPPKRRNNRLTPFCDINVEITKEMLKTSLLPDPVINPNTGTEYAQHDSWK